MAYPTRKEMDDIKPQIEKAVHKFLGFGEPSIVTTAVNCIASGYDKRKTAGMLLFYDQHQHQHQLYCRTNLTQVNINNEFNLTPPQS